MNAATYRSRLAVYREWLASLPFEHGLRKREPTMAHERWLAEADAYEAYADERWLPRVALLLDSGNVDEAGYLATLASWHLQSWPNVSWLLWESEPAAWAKARAAHGLPAPLATVTGAEGLSLSPLGVDWLVLAQAGDLLHPSLAGQVAIAGMSGAEAVAWDFLRHQRSRTAMRALTRHRGPGFDPVLDLVRDTRGRAYALPAARAEGAGTCPGDAWSLRLRAAAGIERWHVIPEPLATYPAEPAPTVNSTDRDLFVACSQASWQTVMDWTQAAPVPATPAASISVILLFRDRPALTLAAIDSILRQQVSGTLELVLVDNQSCPETVQAIQSRLATLDPRIHTRWLSYDQPFNHSRQCQIGAQAASGEVLVFLNNDACLLDDFALDRLSRWSRLPGVASVGARIVDGHGATIGGGFLARRLPGAEFNSPVEEAKGSFAELSRCTVGNTFACAAVSAEAFRRIGLDPVRFPIGFNDVDYCLRASRDGWRHVNLAEVRVLHAVGASRARMDEIAQKLWIRSEHPWLFTRALCEYDIENLPSTLAIEYPLVLLPIPPVSALEPST
jgi:GT2 family glycosyltransferase